MRWAIQQEWWRQLAREPLVAAFLFSIVIHTALYACYRLMPESFLVGRGLLARWVSNLMVTPEAERKTLEAIQQMANQKILEAIQALQEQEMRETPLAFVEVDPALASTPPAQPKYRSTHSTVAANPEPAMDSSQPRIEGTAQRVPRLVDNPRPEPRSEPQSLVPWTPSRKPEPAPPAESRTELNKTDKHDDLRPNSRPDAKSEPMRPLENLAERTHERAVEKPDLKLPGGETSGEVAVGSPKNMELARTVPGSGSPTSANPLITDPSPPPRQSRPRTLAQAYQQRPMIAGRLMQQEGGVRNRGRVSIDAKGSPFGAYDAAFIAAVQERWYQLLEKNQYMLDRRGKVVLDFQLRSDGRIVDMHVADNTVGELLGILCQRAVLDPAPYARWPGDMRRMIGRDYREVRFTFYYD